MLLLTKVPRAPGRLHLEGEAEASDFLSRIPPNVLKIAQSPVASTSPSKSFCVVISSVCESESGAGITDDKTAKGLEHGSDVRTSVFWSQAASLLIAGGALDPMTSAHINLDKFAGY